MPNKITVTLNSCTWSLSGLMHACKLLVKNSNTMKRTSGRSVSELHAKIIYSWEEGKEYTYEIK